MGEFEEEWERPEFESVPSLARQIIYRLPGIDDKTVRFALLDVYRDFCKRGAALRTWRKIEVEPGEPLYMVVPILGGMIDCVTNVLFAHTRCPFRGWRVFGDPPMLDVGRGFGSHEFLVTRAAAEVQDKFNVGSLPVEAVRPESQRFEHVSLLVEAVEIPHIHEERAPRRFLSRYGDAIAEGAYARLASQTNKPWSDAVQARIAAAEYENAIGTAMERGLRGGPAANASPSGAVDFGRAV